MMLTLGVLIVVAGLYVLCWLADYRGAPREITQQIVSDAQVLNREWFP